MPFPVVMGAQLQCAFGAAPSSFIPTPMPKPVLFEGKPVGTIMDFVPVTNIPPFGMCNSPTNPAGMAKPVPTPCPCVPVPTGPWQALAPMKLVGGKPILLQGPPLMCAFGPIMVSNPGTTKEQVS